MKSEHQKGGERADPCQGRDIAAPLRQLFDPERANVAASVVMPYGHFTTGGIEDRIDSTLPPVRRPKMVPRS